MNRSTSRGSRRFGGAALFSWSEQTVDDTGSATVDARLRSRAALRGGSAAFPAHHLVQPPRHHLRHARPHLVPQRSGSGVLAGAVARAGIRVHRVATADEDARHVPVTTPMMLMPIVTPVMTTMAQMPTVTMVAVMLVRMPVRRADLGAKDLGVPLRSSHPTLAVSPSRRRCAPRSSRSSPRSPWPAAPAAGIASAWCRYTSRRAGIGFADHRLAHSAVHECPEKCGQLRAPRHALVPAQVRTLVRAPPPEPPALCRALRLSVVSAPPAAQSPRRLPSAGFAGTVSPIVDAASRCLHGRRRRLVLTPDASMMPVSDGTLTLSNMENALSYRALSDAQMRLRFLPNPESIAQSGHDINLSWLQSANYRLLDVG